MARDRIASWSADRPERPISTIGDALLCYAGKAATWLESGPSGEGHRHAITLVGEPTNPFDTDGDRTLHRAAIAAGVVPSERGFEVWIGNDYIDVITRQADVFTNAVADGFFLSCVRHWGMRVDPVTAREFAESVKSPVPD